MSEPEMPTLRFSTTGQAWWVHAPLTDEFGRAAGGALEAALTLIERLDYQLAKARKIPTDADLRIDIGDLAATAWVDGEHHKQWALAQILRLVNTPEQMTALIAEHGDLDEGIPG